MRIGNRVKTWNTRTERRGVIVSGHRRASPGMSWVLWDGEQAPFQVNRYYLRLDKPAKSVGYR